MHETEPNAVLTNVKKLTATAVKSLTVLVFLYMALAYLFPARLEVEISTSGAPFPAVCVILAILAWPSRLIKFWPVRIIIGVSCYALAIHFLTFSMFGVPSEATDLLHQKLFFAGSTFISGAAYVFFGGFLFRSTLSQPANQTVAEKHLQRGV